MSRVFAWFFSGYFLIGGLSPRTDLAQFWHLGPAWHHYLEHRKDAQEKGNSFSLLNFFKDHYLNPESHDHGDTHSHRHLPLAHLHSVLELFYSSGLIVLTGLENQIFSRAIIHREHFYFFLFLRTTDRPPCLI